MNLYRSFGNLLETWVTEGVQGCSELDEEEEEEEEEEEGGSGLGCGGLEDGGGACGLSAALSGRTRLSEAEARTPLLWSESEDSGLEMASSETSLPSPRPDRPASARDEDAGSWSPPPLSPVLPPPSPFSSPSPGLGGAHAPPGPQHGSNNDTHLKLEQALQRADPARGQGVEKDPKLPGDQARLRRCRAASLPRQHAGGGQIYRTGQRSSLGPRREVNPVRVCLQASERHRRAVSLYLDTLPAQTEPEGEEAGPGLSPGLGYLEHVCRMLEEIAKLQIRNRALQTEMDVLCEQQAEQENQTTSESQSHQCASKPMDDDDEPSTNPRFEAHDLDISSQLPFTKDAFRRRTSSDTQVLGTHLRKLNMASRGQCLSAEGLLEQTEDEEKIKEIKKETDTKGKTWKFGTWKIASLKRGASTLSNSSQMHSAGEKTSGSRFGELFRRWRTLPA